MSARHLSSFFLVLLLSGAAPAGSSPPTRFDVGASRISEGNTPSSVDSPGEQSECVAWRDLAEHLARQGRSLLQLDLCDCPEAILDAKPARIVAQYIENTFYLWREYDIAVDSGSLLCIVMDKPEPALLTAEESRVLLTGSMLWRRSISQVDAETPPEGGLFRIQEPIGTDDRTRITNTLSFPWNTHCALESHFSLDPTHYYAGTGCLVSPYMVLTCAHNIHSLKLASSISRMSVIPGRRQDVKGGLVEKPYGTAEIVDFRVASGYPGSLPGIITPDDYGAVFLGQPFPGINTYMPVEFSEGLSVGNTVRIAGYAGDVKLGTSGAEEDTQALWDASGPIADVVYSDRLFYAVDTSSGDSGTAIRRGAGTSLDPYRIIGIHSGYNPARSLNWGCRLGAHNQAVITEWMQWRPTTVLPAELTAVAGAQYPSVTGLAEGSRTAQESQKQAVQGLGLPLEVKTRKTGIVFRLIPAGTFMMGSVSGQTPRTNEGPRHQVTLTRAFYCGKFEITQSQWQQVMGKNPSYSKSSGLSAPVEGVKWDDCQQFLKKLCQTEGVVEGTYRLLTEAEWEYACRGGTQTPFCYGNDLDASMANFNGVWPYGGGSAGPYRGRPITVGGFQPNAWGLFDMHGNVWEWCQDRYGDYSSTNATDPSGSGSGDGRVIRGGGWGSRGEDCRSAVRYSFSHDLPDAYVGLRVARTVPSATGNLPDGATVLTFEGLAGDLPVHIPSGYGGLVWSSAFSVGSVDGWEDSGYVRGVVSPDSVAYNGSARDVEVSGGPFDFVGAYMTAAWRDSLTVEIRGYRSDLLLYTATVSVDAAMPTWVRLDFSGVDRVTFSSFGGTKSALFQDKGAHFVMDDMVIRE